MPHLLIVNVKRRFAVSLQMPGQQRQRAREVFSGVDQEITQVQVSDGRVLLNVRNL